MDPIISQPEPQYQAPVLKHKHFLNKKFIVTFVILLLLGAGASAGVWLWFNDLGCNFCNDSIIEIEDVTTNWKTYTNTQYGFEFKYPAEKYILNGSDGIDYENIVLQEKSKLDNLLNHILVVVKPNPSKLALKEWLNKNRTDMVVEDRGTVTVGGTTGLQYVEGGVTNFLNTYVSHNDTVIEFTAASDFANISDYNQILSTFKFIDSVDTLTWKTYKNEKAKTEFKYPSNFQIVSDKVHITYGNGAQWYRFEMQDKKSAQEPYMIFEVNPDGYGPFFPSEVYTLKENPDGTVSIVDRKKETSEYTSPDVILVIVKPLESKNGNIYSWRFNFKKGEVDYQLVFDQILSTFKFTK